MTLPNQDDAELTRQTSQPAMHQKRLLRAAELVDLGWTRGRAARDNAIEALDRASSGARGEHRIRLQPERRRDRRPE
jgi:hypothetical protein